MTANDAKGEACSPQLENGFVRIANEIMDALYRIKIPGRQWQIILAVIRMTYGFNRTLWITTNSEIAGMVGMNRHHTCADIKELVERKILIVTENGNKRSVEVKFNKIHTLWVLLPKTVTNSSLPKTVTIVTENGNVSLPKTVTVPLKTYRQNKDKGRGPLQKAEEIPYVEIVKAWNDAVGETLPKVSMKLITSKRKAAIRARWLTSDNTKSVEWWRGFFAENVAGSDFMMGKCKPAPGRRPFRASFDWVMELENFCKVVEGNFLE